MLVALVIGGMLLLTAILLGVANLVMATTKAISLNGVIFLTSIQILCAAIGAPLFGSALGYYLGTNW
jgi:hypothetical protein